MGKYQLINNMNQKPLKIKGFLLIEIIVSIAIFIVVAVVAVGSLLKILDANKKALSLKNTINSLNYTVESMTREMRVGSMYYCDHNILSSVPASYTPQNCDDPEYNDNWILVFQNQDCSELIAYRFVKDKYKIQKANVKSGTFQACSGVISDTSFQDITPPSIKITDSRMKVISESDTQQPYAVFSITAESGTKIKDKVSFTIKSTVSQRIR